MGIHLEKVKLCLHHTLHHIEFKWVQDKKCKQQNYKSAKNTWGNSVTTLKLGKAFWTQHKIQEGRKKAFIRTEYIIKNKNKNIKTSA